MSFTLSPIKAKAVATHELWEDYWASLDDIRICGLAQRTGATCYAGNRSIQDHIDINPQIMGAIETELTRRAALTNRAMLYTMGLNDGRANLYDNPFDSPEYDEGWSNGHFWCNCKCHTKFAICY